MLVCSDSTYFHSTLVESGGKQERTKEKNLFYFDEYKNCNEYKKESGGNFPNYLALHIIKVTKLVFVTKSNYS